jgi:glucose-6-phosphate 1-dehydrogenase
MHSDISLKPPKIFCAEQPANPFTIIIFGASGDLAHRKLIPSLFNLFRRRLLPEQFDVIGVASPLHFYDAGSWGPHEADALIKENSRKWRAL